MQHNMASRAAAVFVLIAFTGQVLSTANPTAIQSNPVVQDGRCHCEANVTVNIPACICSDVVETVAENLLLRAQVRDLRENCTTVNIMELPLLYTSHRVEVEGIRWTRFWWYNPISGWPTGERDVLGVPYGACLEDANHCFGRLPGALRESDTELLAVDSAGTIYRWRFNPGNPTAHAAWNAFYHHLDQQVINSRPWNPYVIAGPRPNAIQDSFMYRSQYGVRSVLLDDDNCDCLTTLSMGHGMCTSGFSTSYGPVQRFGVDTLYDTHCQTPDPKHGLSLYFRDNNECIGNPCPASRVCVDAVNSYNCI